MIICIFKSLVGYFILMLIGTNLLGLVVRGLFPSYNRDSLGNLRLVDNTHTRSSILVTFFSGIICLIYIYGLYYYWNIGISLAGVLILVSRLPDLLYEMRTGELISLKNMRKRPIDIVCSFLLWGTLPLIWYSLCYLK
jgi:hypothetical protein